MALLHAFQICIIFPCANKGWREVTQLSLFICLETFKGKELSFETWDKMNK